MTEHKENLSEVIDDALHLASRNAVGLALLQVAFRCAELTDPEADFESQFCLSLQLVKDTLTVIKDEQEIMTVTHYLRKIDAVGNS